MPNNQFKKGELYSFITGKASTAVARRLQKNFKQSGVDITIDVYAEMFHVFQAFWLVLSTAKKANAKLGQFLKAQMV